MPGNVCQVFSSKNIEKYHWGIYHLIESNRLYSLLQDDKYSTKKKEEKENREGRLKLMCGKTAKLWMLFEKYFLNILKISMKGIWHEYSRSSSLSSTPFSDISTDVTFSVFFIDFCPSSVCSNFTFLVWVSLCVFSYLKLWLSAHLNFSSTLPIHCLEFIFHHIFHHMNNQIFCKLISWLSVFSN